MASNEEIAPSSESPEFHVRLYIYEWQIKNIPMMLPCQKRAGPPISLDKEERVKLNLWIETRKCKHYVIGGTIESSGCLKDILNEAFIQVYFVDSKDNILCRHISLAIGTIDLQDNSLVFEKGGDISCFFRGFSLSMRAEIAAKLCKVENKEESSLLSATSLTSLTTDLENLLENGRACSDVTLKVCGDTYNLHECILYQRWPYLEELSVDFNNMSFDDIEGITAGITQPHPKVTFTRRGSSTIIQLDDDVHDVLLSILYYIYCEKIIPMAITKYFKLFWISQDLRLEGLCENLLPNVMRSKIGVKYDVSCHEFSVKNFSSRENGEAVASSTLNSYMREGMKWKIMLVSFSERQTIQIRLRKLSGTDFATLIGLKVYIFTPDSKYYLGSLSHYFKKLSPPEEIPSYQEAMIEFPIQRHHISEDTLLLFSRLYVSCGDFECTNQKLFNENQSELEPQNLARSLKDLYLTGRLSNLTLYVNDFAFKVHKALLCARCPGLADVIMGSSNKYAKSIYIDETRIPTEITEQILLFIYTNEIVDMSNDNVKMLYKAAKFYDLPQLKEICTDFAKQNMDIKDYEEFTDFVQKECDLNLSQQDQNHIRNKRILVDKNNKVKKNRCSSNSRSTQK